MLYIYDCPRKASRHHYTFCGMELFRHNALQRYIKDNEIRFLLYFSNLTVLEKILNEMKYFKENYKYFKVTII